MGSGNETTNNLKGTPMKRMIMLTLTLALAMPALAADYKADFSKALDKGWSFVREDKAE